MKLFRKTAERRAPFFISDENFCEKSIVGKRERQEDFSKILLSPEKTELVFVLADGMGGHAGGEIASRAAVDAFLLAFQSYPSNSIAGKLAIGLQKANSELASKAMISPELAGMGCTLVGLHIGPTGLQWISVGDSPLFLIRDGRLLRLNADHSMNPVLQASLRKGTITQEEAEIHPHRNALRSAVTGDEITLIDSSIDPLILNADDVLILASDGILTLSEKEIIQQSAPRDSAIQISSRLLEFVQRKNKPRQDNTTVQVVLIPGQDKRRSRRTLLKSNRTAVLVMALGIFVIVIGLLALKAFDLILKGPRGAEVTGNSQQIIAQTRLDY